MAVSDAQRKATAKYEKKAYVQVRTRFKPNDAQRLYEHVEMRKESVNGFINRSVIEQIERDNAGTESVNKPNNTNATIIKEDTPNDYNALPSLEALEPPQYTQEELQRIAEALQAEKDRQEAEEEYKRLMKNIEEFGV